MKSNAVVFWGVAYPGGIVRHLALLGCELHGFAKGYDCYFAATVDGRDKDAWRVARASIPTENCIEANSFQELVSKTEDLFARYKRVLIHCGGGWYQTRLLMSFRKKYGRRLVLVGTTHSYRHDSAMRIPMSSFQTLLYLRYYDVIVFQCPYAADRFWGSKLLFAAGKGAVIPLGCESFSDIGKEAPEVISCQQALVQTLSDKSLFKFVYLASFRPGKKHIWLVRALAPVLRRHPEARVLFCGRGDESSVSEVKKAIARHGLTRNILLTGHIPRNEVPWLLLHANAAIVPSRAETFGHNFLEPMFAGLPVLGTLVGVGRDIIHEGKTGYSFSLRSMNSARFGAERILSDVENARVMGKCAREMVLNQYSHANVARQLTALYERLLQ